MRIYWTRLQDRLERLRANKLFETFVILVIVTSALLIGAKTYEEASRFDQLINWLDLAGSKELYKHGLSILWGISSMLLVIYGIWKKKKQDFM